MRARRLSPVVALSLAAAAVMVTGGRPGVASAAPAAAAAPADAEAHRAARRHFQRGEAHFKAGRYSEALAAYEAGYRAAPLPGFLVNIAQCHRRLGDLHKARATYKKFVLVAPDSPLVPDVEKLIGELDRALAELDGKAAEPSATAPPPASAASSSEELQALTMSDWDAVSPPTRPVLVAAPAPETNAAPTGERPAGSARGGSRTRWWIWGGVVAAAVVGGTIAAFALTSSPEPRTVSDGSLGTLRR